MGVAWRSKSCRNSEGKKRGRGGTRPPLSLINASISILDNCINYTAPMSDEGGLNALLGAYGSDSDTQNGSAGEQIWVQFG